MTKTFRLRKRILILIAGILVIFNLAVFLYGGTVYGLTGDEGSGKTVLAFTSDIHNTAENTAANRLDSWLDKVKKKYGHIDVMSFCGDMGSARAQENEFWTYTKSVMDVVDREPVRGVYTTGNHEFYNGKFSETQNAVLGSYKVGGVGEEAGNYIIYCLGTDNWDDHKDNYPESQIESLKDFLNSTGNDKPIIILTHYPLHTFGSGRMVRHTTNAGLVIDALNEAAGSGKKIVLLWGHNHTVKDTYYDQIYAPGESIEYESGSSKELKFYYGAAGCMSDSEYGSGSAFVKGKGLVITIDNDKRLTFAYYDTNGNNVTEGGTYSEEPVQAEKMFIEESVEEGEDGQPVTVGKTIEAGRKLQLHLHIEPEDATSRGLTWSSSNEDVATVSQSGLVKGVSEGTVTITAKIPAAEKTVEVSAAIEITVTQKDKTPVFVLTDKIEPGKRYIIANNSTGTAYALTNDNGSAGITEVRIDGDRITANDEDIIFTAEAIDETGVNIRNEENYLQVGMGSMSFQTSAPGGRPWNYGTDRILTCKGSRSNYFIYYDGSGFRAGMDAMPVDESVSKEVYLFAETEIKTADITYKLGGGTYNGSPEDIVETHDDGETITIHEAPVREGYTFSYWEGSEYKPGDSYTVSGDHTFTAVWTENKEDSEEGEYDDSDSSEYDGSGSSGSDSSGSNKSEKHDGRPKTGDSGYAFYLLTLIVSVAALTAMLAVRALNFARSKR